MKRLYFILTFSILTATLVSCSDNKLNDTATTPTAVTDSIKTKVPDEFIDLLFADQSIQQLDNLASARTIGNKSIWTDFLSATQEALQHKNDEAIAAFRLIADDKTNEPRVRLWAWNGLRSLGVRPKKVEILGLILEVPQQGSTEFLAMYADRSARYINYSGMVVVWEQHEHKMDSLMGASFKLADQIVAKQALTHERSHARTNKVRFSFLTTDGLMQAEKSIEALNDPKDNFTRIFGNSVQVLSEMVNRAKTTPKE